MFFDDAAACAQRKRRRLVLALGAERRERKWRQGRVVTRKFHQDHVADAVSAHKQCRMGLVVEVAPDLSSEVDADVKDLVGVSEHKRQRRRNLYADRAAFGLQL